MKKIMLILVAIAGMAVNANAQIDGQDCPLKDQNGNIIGVGRTINSQTGGTTSYNNSNSSSHTNGSSQGMNSQISTTGGHVGNNFNTNQSNTGTSSYGNGGSRTYTTDCVDDKTYDNYQKEKARRQEERRRNNEGVLSNRR